MNAADIKAALPIAQFVGEHVELKPKGRNLIGLCPFHADRNTPNLVVFPDKSRWECFCCGKQGSVFDFAGHLKYNGSWTGKGEQFLTVKNELLIRLGSAPPATLRRASVALLAEDKGIPEEFLRREMGIRDANGAVEIPYRDADGRETHVKRRSALAANQGSWWPKGVPPEAYGEERWAVARERGYGVLCEGESDTWTLRLHGVPVLGIPGANATRALEARHLEGIPVLYVVQESGVAGPKFVEGVGARLAELGYVGRVRVLVMAEAHKDPNGRYGMDPGGFSAWMERIMDGAPDLEFLSHPIKEGGTETPADWRRLFRSVDAVLSEKVTAEAWLADALVPLGWPILLAGRTKVGKTLLALALAYAVATGGTFLGRRCRKGAVVLALVDDPPAITHPRLAKLAGMDNVFVYTGRYGEEVLPALREAVAELKPALVVWDTLVKVIPKRDKAENDSATMDAAMEYFATLSADVGCSVVVIHHLTKGGDVRGSTAIPATAPMVIKAKREEGKPDVELEVDWKLEPIEPLMVRYEGDDWKVLGDKRSVKASEMKEQIVAALAEPPEETWGTSTEIAEAIEARRTDAQEVLTSMVHAGELAVESVKGATGRSRKVYRVTPEFLSRAHLLGGTETPAAVVSQPDAPAPTFEDDDDDPFGPWEDADDA